MSTVELIATLIELGLDDVAIRNVEKLANTLSAVEAERDEALARVEELEANSAKESAYRSDVISERLKKYIDADYFADVIKGVYTLIAHAAFMEKEVESLKGSIANIWKDEQK